MFEHLNDPNPPGVHDDTRAAVARRAGRIRRRQHVAQTVMTCVVVLLLAGVGAVALGRRGGSQEQLTESTGGNCCGAIEGTITGQGGARAGVTVTLMFDHGPIAGTTVAGTSDGSTAWPIKSSNVLTDQAGHYRLDGLEPGAYVVRFQDKFDPLVGKTRFEPDFFHAGPNAAPVFSQATPVTVTKDHTSVADDSLRLSPNFGIQGSVHEYKTQGTEFPIAHITAQLYVDGELTREALTDDNGNYDFGGLDPGEYTVTFVDRVPARDNGGSFRTAKAESGHTITMTDAAEVMVPGELVRQG